MSDGAMVISGIGLHSSFGGVVPAAAAFRCGMSRAVELAEWPYFDEDDHEDHSLIGHPALGVSLGFRGIARLLKLGTEALADLGDTVDLASLDPARTGITLVLSPSSSKRDWTPHEVLQRLCKLAGLQFDPRHQRESVDGRTGVADALAAAEAQIRSGQVDRIIVGAIDTLLTPDRIAALLKTDEIKTADNPVGFMPGEASAFILLESLAAAKRQSRHAAAVVRALAPATPVPQKAFNEKPAVSAPAPGNELGGLVLAALSAGSAPPAEGMIYADLNGTTPRAMDFGNAMVQVSVAVPLGGWQHAFPALTFGETGAASGLVAICMALRAFARGYAQGDHALVAMSCESGRKAAVLLERAKAA